MTLEDFLVQLGKTPRKWKIDRERIRMEDVDGFWGSCPITSLLGRAVWEWADAADELGLAPELAREIANAADCKTSKPIRKLLLEACGLTEQSMVESPDRQVHAGVTDE